MYKIKENISQLFTTLINRETPIMEDKDIFPDLPFGPLTVYRQKASFDYKKVSLILEPEDAHRLRVKSRIYSFTL